MEISGRQDAPRRYERYNGSWEVADSEVAQGLDSTHANNSGTVVPYAHV